MPPGTFFPKTVGPPNPELWEPLPCASILPHPLMRRQPQYLRTFNTNLEFGQHGSYLALVLLATLPLKQIVPPRKRAAKGGQQGVFSRLFNVLALAA